MSLKTLPPQAVSYAQKYLADPCVAMNLLEEAAATVSQAVLAKQVSHKVAREIHDSGGKVCRVILDYQLKRELYRKLSRIDPNKELAYERIGVANEYDLKVVNGKIPVPDQAATCFMALVPAHACHAAHGSWRVDQDRAGFARPFGPRHNAQHVCSRHPGLATARCGAGRGSFVLECSRI